MAVEMREAVGQLGVAGCSTVACVVQPGGLLAGRPRGTCSTPIIKQAPPLLPSVFAKIHMARLMHA